MRSWLWFPRFAENEQDLNHQAHEQEFAYRMQLQTRTHQPRKLLGPLADVLPFVADGWKQSDRLKVSSQSKNYDDEEDQSESSTWPVSPPGTIRPRWERADQQQD
jgi:hypothetical protein